MSTTRKDVIRTQSALLGAMGDLQEQIERAIRGIEIQAPDMAEKHWSRVFDLLYGKVEQAENFSVNHVRSLRGQLENES